jgi:hypothetical protein
MENNNLPDEWIDVPLDEQTEVVDEWIDVPLDDGFTEDISPSKLESGLRGGIQGATFGFADEIAGGVTGLGRYAKSKLQGKDTNLTDEYYRARDESRLKFKEAEEVNPLSYGAGQVGGAISTALIPGLGKANIGRLAAQGAAHGLGHSEAEDLKGMAKDAAWGGATGAVAGGAGQILKGTTSLGRGIQKVGEAVKGNNITNALTGGQASSAIVTGKVIEGGGLFLDKITQKLANTKFGPALTNAAKRGGTSLAAANFVLQQTSEEYRNKLKEINAEEEDD